MHTLLIDACILIQSSQPTSKTNFYLAYPSSKFNDTHALLCCTSWTLPKFPVRYHTSRLVAEPESVVMRGTSWNILIIPQHHMVFWGTEKDGEESISREAWEKRLLKEIGDQNA